MRKRAATQAVKQSDQGKAFLAAVKALDKAIEAAWGTTRCCAPWRPHARTLGKHLIKMGVRAR